VEEAKMRKNHLNKILVVSIVVLFIGIGIHPAFAKHPIESTDAIMDEGIYKATDIDPKDYLFQTIIDITNNQEAKILLESMKIDGSPIKFNYNFRSIYREILLEKPLLLLSIILSRASISHSYINNCFKMGSEITNIVGENRVIEIIDSTQVINTEFFNELNNIIMEDEYLSSRVTALQGMDFDPNPNNPLKNSSGICDILIVLYLLYIVRYIFSNLFGNLFEHNFLLDKFFSILWFKNWILAGVCFFIFDFFDCDH
jgi:hypothetical protein